jgi:hypothetical protein
MISCYDIIVHDIICMICMIFYWQAGVNISRVMPYLISYDMISYVISYVILYINVACDIMYDSLISCYEIIVYDII